jgi:hypothetical protein
MMRGVGIVIAALIVASIFTSSCAGEGQQDSIVEESGDAPGKLWESGGMDEKWQVISPNNSTTMGSFSLNDSVDVFALEISSTNWTMVGFWVTNNESIRISIQRLNQSTWTIVEFADGNEGELGLNPGMHAIRLERNGDFEEEIAYRFTIENKGVFEDGVEFVNLAWMFTPFYVFAGLFLILPLIIVLWWNRRDFLPSKKVEELEENEKHVLNALRDRFATNDLAKGSEEVSAALSILGKGSWGSVTKELGDPEIRHFTENIDICVWRFEDSSNSLLVGVRTEAFSWEMAAIRIFSPLGEVTSIQNVVPEMIFRDDEVFLGDLDESSTTFVQIETMGNPPVVNIQISGLVGGNPIAAVPTNSIDMGEE